MEVDLIDHDSSEEQKQLYYRVIAIGVNSLAEKNNLVGNYGGSPEDKAIFEQFIKQSFVEILKCWEYLNLNVKFQIFKIHEHTFKDYMLKHLTLDKPITDYLETLHG